MFDKYWANRIRYYTSKVHLRGLRQNQGFQTQVAGFRLCSQATALGGFPDSLSGARFPIAF
ncbi:hypothetical protein [Nostoc sp. FACHB-110]|uniref:hypothetical protein n=1 Tax=Nostoc sp. FACHB-110 TaxID=2692834 RepID=UPI0016846E70|nr:hypothetical protein [Nostoc sp. FACHB-110]MBD2439497.1 hypothetical protein [Nostoc sp. FACHB-110]